MSEQKDSSLQQNDERIYRINKEIFDKLPKNHKKYYQIIKKKHAMDEKGYIIKVI